MDIKEKERALRKLFDDRVSKSYTLYFITLICNCFNLEK